MARTGPGGYEQRLHSNSRQPVMYVGTAATAFQSVPAFVTVPVTVRVTVPVTVPATAPAPGSIADRHTGRQRTGDERANAKGGRTPASAPTIELLNMLMIPRIYLALSVSRRVDRSALFFFPSGHTARAFLIFHVRPSAARYGRLSTIRAVWWRGQAAEAPPRSSTGGCVFNPWWVLFFSVSVSALQR